MTHSRIAREPTFRLNAANDDLLRLWDEDGYDSLLTATITPELRTRMDAARRDLEAQALISTIGWSTDHLMTALRMVDEGYSPRDAVAIVIGDAVIEDGRVDYDPGCAWIDLALAARTHGEDECERILARWEAQHRSASAADQGDCSTR